jgi:hypothetical protein
MIPGGPLWFNPFWVYGVALPSVVLGTLAGVGGPPAKYDYLEDRRKMRERAERDIWEYARERGYHGPPLIYERK